MKPHLQHLHWLTKRRLKLGLTLRTLGSSRYSISLFPPQPATATHSVFPKHFHSSSLQCLRLTAVLTTEYFDALAFEHVSSETLDSLNERLEELIEQEEAPVDSDITLVTGVITMKLGTHGTYVINKQTPNKQIWLSSPFSGPKRYDLENNQWIYKHDGTSLHTLLSKELSKVFNMKIDLSTCEYGGESS